MMSKGMAALLVVLALTPSCDRVGIGFVKIGDLLSKPQEYSGEVRVRGKVSNAIKIPFVVIALYAVNDGTGEIVVRSEKGVPLSGGQIKVKGSLEALADVGGVHIGLHLREIERW